MRKPVQKAAVTIACLTLLTGCSGWKWWATKQLASGTAEDVAEATHLSKTKEELREEIKEIKQQLRTEKDEKSRLETRIRDLEAACAKKP